MADGRARSRLPLLGRWRGGGAGDKVADTTVNKLVEEGVWGPENHPRGVPFFCVQNLFCAISPAALTQTCESVL